MQRLLRTCRRAPGATQRILVYTVKRAEKTYGNATGDAGSTRVEGGTGPSALGAYALHGMQREAPRLKSETGAGHGSYERGRSMMSSMMPYSLDCAAVMMKSRSTSCSMRSSGCPVLELISLLVISRMRRISRAWMSMSVAWPLSPPIDG